MNKAFVLIFLLLNSCLIGQGSGLNSKIDVAMVPYTSADKVIRDDRKLAIFLKGGRQVCRPSPFKARDFRTALKLKSEKVFTQLEDKFLDELFRVGEESGSTTSSASNKAVYLDVGDNWLKFGLVIANHNTGTEVVNNKKTSKNFFLIIDSIKYNAKARYGKQEFSHAGNINPGYCDTNAEGGETPSFLYLVTPGTQVNYRPLSRNPLENLTIYISGFPIIDRSSQPSFSQQQGIQGGGVNLQGFYSQGDIRKIPEYSVELTLLGYFITKSGAKVPGPGFDYRFSFSAR